MVKKQDEVKELTEKYNDLLKENELLKNELKENTIVESMNDMKKQYEHLRNTTVPFEHYDHVKNMLKQTIKLLNSIETINNLNKTHTHDLVHHINDDENISIKIKHDIFEICRYSQIISDSIVANEEEYLDDFCFCYNID